MQGIADGGAFLNGQFYRVGGDVAALGIQSMEQGQVTPKLIAVSASAVTFRVGGERVVIEKGGAGWQ